MSATTEEKSRHLLEQARDMVSTPTKEIDMNSMAQRAHTIHHEPWCATEACDIDDHGDSRHVSYSALGEYRLATAYVHLAAYGYGDGTLLASGPKVSLVLTHKEVEEDIYLDLLPAEAVHLAHMLLAHTAILNGADRDDVLPGPVAA